MLWLGVAVIDLVGVLILILLEKIIIVKMYGRTVDRNIYLERTGLIVLIALAAFTMAVVVYTLKDKKRRTSKAVSESEQCSGEPF